MATETTKTDAVLKLLRAETGRHRGAAAEGDRVAAAQRPGGPERAAQEGPRHPAGEERKGRHRLQDRRTMNRHADEDRIAGELSAIPGLTARGTDRALGKGTWPAAAQGPEPPIAGIQRCLSGAGEGVRRVEADGPTKVARPGGVQEENVQIDTNPMPVQGPLARHRASSANGTACPIRSRCLRRGSSTDGKTYRSPLQDRPCHHRRPLVGSKVLRTVSKRVRCAIYTRKSTEEGLEQEFNSLDAQREACEAYIQSQRSQGWVIQRKRYDDGGLSGGDHGPPRLAGSAGRHREGGGRSGRRLQGGSPDPLAHGLRQDRRDVRCPRCLLRLRHPAVQHRQLDGAPDVARAALLCPVRT